MMRIYYYLLYFLFQLGHNNYVNVAITSQHRLSGQSYESGVSGVSVTSSSRQSYHSNSSSSSLGSLDRLEESGYSSTVNVHELFQAGLSVSTTNCCYWLLTNCCYWLPSPSVSYYRINIGYHQLILVSN